MARQNKLTEKQRLFVHAFLNESKGNATDAARRAGVPRTSAAQQAWKWLRKAHIQQALTARQERREKRAELTNEEIDRALSAFAQDERMPPAVRLGAFRELNKTRGRHSIKHVVEGSLTLEDYIDASRRPEATS